jgi:hypothetical protein
MEYRKGMPSVFAKIEVASAVMDKGAVAAADTGAPECAYAFPGAYPDMSPKTSVSTHTLTVIFFLNDLYILFASS